MSALLRGPTLSVRLYNPSRHQFGSYRVAWIGCVDGVADYVGVAVLFF
jgi:hypothetical protein